MPAGEERIVVDPEIMAGKPVVKGTRITVEVILKRLAQDVDVASLLEAYPRLSQEDIEACLPKSRKPRRGLGRRQGVRLVRAWRGL